MASGKKLSQAQTAVNLQQQLYTLEKNINQKLYTFDEIGAIVPGVVLVDNLVDKTNDYMNHNGCRVLQSTSEELNQMGEEYFRRFFVQEEVSEIFKLVGQLIQSKDRTAVTSFFQRVRPHQNAPYEWYYMTTKLLTEGETDPDNIKKIILIGTRVNDMTPIASKVNRVLEENEYAKKNFHLFARLTKREKEILALMALGYKNREIAEQTFIAEATVEQHRKNIRRKLEAKSLAHLIRFALAFDLI